MAAASSSVPLFGIREDGQYNINHQQQQQHSSSKPSSSAVATTAPQKKKRNLPGNPNPDAEVIALSPRTLLATNRFICEVCNKGFQREQNLQLHRRGHNLPWKLKQKNPKEVRRRVYLCPEPTCVHHEPARALGDLTGIKKHYCRKHGEKKWKCDKCSKRYAVQSDWKAHSKTCGTREYRCDCGTLFSRRDSFITHRAFCDALAQEGARIPAGINNIGGQVNSHLSSLHEQTAHAYSDLLRLGGAPNATQFDHLNASLIRQPQVQPTHSSPFFLDGGGNQNYNEGPQLLQGKPFQGLMQMQDLQANSNPASSSSAAAAASIYNLGFFSNAGNSNSVNSDNNGWNQNGHLLNGATDQFSNQSGSTDQSTLFAGNMMSSHMGTSMSSMYNPSVHNEAVLPQMSATALLQKAAQMGATSSGGNGSSLLSGFDCSYSGAGKHANFDSNGGGEISRTQVYSENNFQDLMNSLANGNSGMFTGGTEQASGFGVFNRGLSNMNESKLHQNLSAAGMGGSDRLTRDFLGVSGMMRSMGGGGRMAQREQQRGIDVGSLDRLGSTSRYSAEVACSKFQSTSAMETEKLEM